MEGWDGEGWDGVFKGSSLGSLGALVGAMNVEYCVRKVFSAAKAKEHGKDRTYAACAQLRALAEVHNVDLVVILTSPRGRTALRTTLPRRHGCAR